MFYFPIHEPRTSVSIRQMRCLANILNAQDCPQDCRRTSTCKERRLAALRKAVEGLQPVTRGEAGAAQAGAGDPRRGCLRGLDWGLPAELPCGALNEVVAAHADRPAAFGFLFALTAMGLGSGPYMGRDEGLELQARPAVFVAARRALSDFGAPYGHGLAQLGLDVGRLIIVETRTDKDALWALEETLRSGVQPALVAGALSGGLDLTSSRRLNLTAAPQRTPLVVLSGADATGTSAAAARWRIAAAPAARDRFGAFAAPRWHVALERCRLGNRHGRPMNHPGAWLIEWNHVSHCFRVAAGLADRPPVGGDSLRHAG
jgi:protein ImuA